jgi:hypothetical protein
LDVASVTDEHISHHALGNIFKSEFPRVERLHINAAERELTLGILRYYLAIGVVFVHAGIPTWWTIHDGTESMQNCFISPPTCR